MDREREDLVNLQPVRCPRCGYDQRGVVAAWTESCELNGQCSECGLPFRWVEILCADRFQPRWVVEHPDNRGRRFVVASAQTLVRSLWPFGFWRRITMAQHLRLRAIVAYLALLVLTLPLLYVVIVGGMSLYVWINFTRGLQLEYESLPKSIAVLEMNLALPDSDPFFQLDADAISPTDARRLMQQHIAHVKELLSAGPPQVSLSWFMVIFEAIWFPFARSSVGTIEPGEWGEYPPPSQLLLTFLEYAYAQRGSSGRWMLSEHEYRETADLSGALLLLGTTFGLLFPAALVLLPITRRRARVRWAHIGRVLLYSLFVPVVAIWLAVMVFAMSLMFIDRPLHPQVLMPAFCGASLLMFWLWWAIAIRRYLRLPHAWAVSGLLGILVLLATPVIIATVGTLARRIW